jgi:hypothetical protein
VENIFVVYAEHDMGLKKQYVNVDTNKTLAVVIRLVEHCSACGHVVWLDSFYNCSEFA